MSRRVLGVLLVAVVAVPAALVVAFVGRGSSTTPHEVPVAVAGSALVAQGIAERLDQQPGDPVAAVVVSEDGDPRALVRDGQVVAALVLQLQEPRDRMLVSTTLDAKMRRLVDRMAVRVGTPLERTFATTEVEPRRHGDVPVRAMAVAPAVWVPLGVLLGLGLVVARRRGHLVRRGAGEGVVLLVAAGGSLVVAVVAASTAQVPVLTWWWVGLLATGAAALVTLALERLGGLLGAVLAGSLLLVLGGPLVVPDPHLLPRLWWEMSQLTLHGTARELAATTVWFAEVPLRPVLVLAGAALVGLVVLLARPDVPEVSPERGAWPVRTRTGLLVVLVPVVLAVLASTVLAPASPDDLSRTAVPQAAETQCLPLPETRDISDLNEFIGRVRSGPAFQGADVGADVALQDGRRLWVFGDTLRSADFSGQRFVRNSMLVIDDSCAHAVVPADHGALIPDRPDGIGYWPMSIARQQRDGYDVVGIAAQRVRSTNQPDGAFAFENLGSSIALFAVLRGKVPQLIWHKDLGPDDADTARPQWGAAAAVHDGWVYLYGTARPNRPGVFGFSLRVARTRMEDLLEPGTWQYWDGKRWQGSPGRAAALIDATRGVSQTLSVFTRGGRWYAVSKRDEFLGTDLTIWSAPSPTGPFDDGTRVARIPSNSETGQLRYMPLAHPDLSPDPSTVVISYSRNNTDTNKVVEDPFLYRPQFLEARLPTGRQQ